MVQPKEEKFLSISDILKLDSGQHIRAPHNNVASSLQKFYQQSAVYNNKQFKSKNRNRKQNIHYMQKIHVADSNVSTNKRDIQKPKINQGNTGLMSVPTEQSNQRPEIQQSDVIYISDSSTQEAEQHKPQEHQENQQPRIQQSNIDCISDSSTQDVVINEQNKQEDQENTGLMSVPNEQQPPNHKANVGSIPVSTTLECAAVPLSKPVVKSTITVHKPLQNVAAKFKCSKCKKKFAKPCYLNQHFRVAHTILPYNCHKCGKKYETMKKLEYHVLRHYATDKPYKCNLCPKQFLHKTDLTRHGISHMDSKPHVCDICHKGFARKDHMLKHKKIHNRNKKK